MNPVPNKKWVLVVAVDDITAKHGAIEITERNPCGFAKVVAQNTSIEGLKPGDIVFFNHQSIQQVRLNTNELHGWIHEENVMGSLSAGEWEAPNKDATKIPKAGDSIVVPGKRVLVH